MKFRIIELFGLERTCRVNAVKTSAPNKHNSQVESDSPDFTESRSENTQELEILLLPWTSCSAQKGVQLHGKFMDCHDHFYIKICIFKDPICMQQWHRLSSVSSVLCECCLLLGGFMETLGFSLHLKTTLTHFLK